MGSCLGTQSRRWHSRGCQVGVQDGDPMAGFRWAPAREGAGTASASPQLCAAAAVGGTSSSWEQSSKATRATQPGARSLSPELRGARGLCHYLCKDCEFCLACSSPESLEGVIPRQ